ncbi:MAG: beta-ketoacyl-ACP synthase III [Clostridia bacterium]|nr:beta-ketoacyl-ACP synthase III [Clostridia bacterium]
MFNTGIEAVDCYAPEKIITNDDLSKTLDTSDEWIFSRTGIKKRHLSTGEDTSQLCTKVAERLLAKSGTDPLEIGLIIVGTITPDYATPSTACLVQGAIGASNAFAFDVSAACSGFVYALSIADKYIKSGGCKKAIVIGAEVLSKIVDWKDRSTCVLFGDGAGGVLLEGVNEGGILAEDIHSKGEDGLKMTGNERKPQNIVYNPEGENNPYLVMDGRAIFNFATRIVPKSINEVLEKSNLKIEDIKYIIPHQANSRIIDVVAKKLNAASEKFYLNISEYANTSAASIPMALGEMDNKGLLEKGDKIIISGFGAGLTWGSMLIEW